MISQSRLRLLLTVIIFGSAAFLAVALLVSMTRPVLAVACGDWLVGSTSCHSVNKMEWGGQIWTWSKFLDLYVDGSIKTYDFLHEAWLLGDHPYSSCPSDCW